MIVFALLYVLVSLWLALYGFNAAYLTALALWRRRRAPTTVPQLQEADLPSVTVQLPLYNEKYVAARLIDAVCALDYPRDRLQIQLLDDSTDETAALVARRVALWRRRGAPIALLRRPERTGFKAGALAHGMTSATGELIAIFDADFAPPPDWLRRSVAALLAPGGERVGLLQTRWAHLNRDTSPLTRAQALALDGHFAIEQGARAEGGLLLNFNGTGGLWRRACIAEAGGWSADTLCEDLDLSYRAQLAGWTIRYDSAIAAPAELPAQIAAYKRQQFRWAKGSIQVARRMAATLLGAPLTARQKGQALLHLSGYALHPLLLAQLLLTLPILLMGGLPGGSYGALLGMLALAGFGAPLLYIVAQLALHGRAGLRHLAWLPMLVLLGMGVALNNSRAVAEGLLSMGSNEFRRTPKFGLEGRSGEWRGSAYRVGVDRLAIGELALALYALLCAAVAVESQQRAAIPFLLLYATAFGYVGAASLAERWGWRRLRRAAPMGA